MSIFRFKQFTINQTGCAMKINTDGVLLAAMAEGMNCTRMLDIGTGTGVMALMMAQRFPDAHIHAVEIDKAASVTAGQNFRNSAFSHRLSVQAIAIEDYVTDQQFDLILSNPPYFVNDLRNIEEKKGIARHAHPDFFTKLITKVDELLTPHGTFWFILPVKQAELLIRIARPYGFSAKRVIQLHSDSSKPAFRWVVCLSRQANHPFTEHFYIYASEKVYTHAYKDLLKSFFLAY